MPYPPNAKKNQQKKSWQKRGSAKSKGGAGRNQDWLYGRHAVLAALENPDRHIDKLYATSNALKDFETLIRQSDLTATPATITEISALLPSGAVHQGIAVKVKPLPETSLEDLPFDRPVIVLDQVTDPHNVGAILRSGAVFHASALIMTRRNSPPVTGVLAKSACGALEHVDMIYVGNLAQALKTLGKIGFWRIGFAGEASDAFENSASLQDQRQPVAIVLGAEDKGLRRLSKEQCDEVCHITTNGALSSLNVSNAAAIALHALDQAKT
ncbi:MAG: 23S rRNA (guanosine(2251)-2'-O)-methyltransferase RlmB [bacterium]|nr:23S rRNA (guanosine(2251)-2'-O)-methyltransferase RlmB [bacterium]